MMKVAIPFSIIHLPVWFAIGVSFCLLLDTIVPKQGSVIKLKDELKIVVVDYVMLLVYNRKHLEVIPCLKRSF
jgi:hypothetical protein